MDFHNTNDAVTRRIQAFTDRVAMLKANDLYFYNQPIQEILPGMKVRVNGREMGMYASYSYLGLVGHPRINAAAKAAVDKFGTGTNGVRTLAGTLTIHTELEETIADFKHAEAAITYTSGYATNLTRHLHSDGARRLRPLRQTQPCLHRGWLPDVRRGVPPLPPQRHGAPRRPCSRMCPKAPPSWSSPIRSSAWTATSSTCRRCWN